MSAAPKRDIACFSYLAAVTTLHVAEYPPADYGVMVDRVERFLAGDGPIVAGAAAASGLTATLVTNRVADDENGRYLIETLRSWGVDGAVVETNPELRAVTPFSTVVSTNTGSRAWFPYLPGVIVDLTRADLTPLTVADVAYIDCYEIFGDISREAVTSGQEQDGFVIANLGGSPPPNWLARRSLARNVSVLQSSVPEDAGASAASIASTLADQAAAERVVVTRGRYGAVVVEGGLEAEIPAPVVPVRGVQGAGAVFTAALAAHLLQGEDLPDAARKACMSASVWCSRPAGFPRGRMLPRQNVLDSERGTV